MVASMGRADGTPLSEREFIVSIMAGLAATVQVGDLERSERMLTIIPAGPVDGEGGELIVGDTERTASVGLHRLQSGDVAGAVAVLRVAGRRGCSRRSTRTCTRPSRWRTWPTARSTRRWPGPTRSTTTTGPPTSTGSPPASPAAWRCHGAATWPRPPPPSTRCGRPPTPPRTACRRRSCAWPTPPPRRPGRRRRRGSPRRGGATPGGARDQRHELAPGVRPRRRRARVSCPTVSGCFTTRR